MFSRLKTLGVKSIYLKAFQVLSANPKPLPRGKTYKENLDRENRTRVVPFYVCFKHLKF